MTDYKELATRIRVQALKMVYRAKSGHIGSSFSTADILAVLYVGILNTDSSNPAWSDRDRFILSKGHGTSTVYTALAQRGFSPTGMAGFFLSERYPPSRPCYSQRTGYRSINRHPGAWITYRQRYGTGRKV